MQGQATAAGNDGMTYSACLSVSASLPKIVSLCIPLISLHHVDLSKDDEEPEAVSESDKKGSNFQGDFKCAEHSRARAASNVAIHSHLLLPMKRTLRCELSLKRAGSIRHVVTWIVSSLGQFAVRRETATQNSI